MFSSPNLPRITLVRTVQAREVAPAFGDAIPSASAPSGPSSTGSASSVPGEEKGGGSGEDTPGDRDAMDVSEGSEAPLPRGVGRLDGKVCVCVCC